MIIVCKRSAGHFDGLKLAISRACVMQAHMVLDRHHFNADLSAIRQRRGLIKQAYPLNEKVALPDCLAVTLA